MGPDLQGLAAGTDQEVDERPGVRRTEHGELGERTSVDVEVGVADEIGVGPQQHVPVVGRPPWRTASMTCSDSGRTASAAVTWSTSAQHGATLAGVSVGA